MATTPMMLDTDILSHLLRGNPAVGSKGRAYNAEYGPFILSSLTQYEILGGLKAKSAWRQLAVFDLFCEKNVVMPLTDEAIVMGADIYAYLRGRGEKIDDLDILIAATALVHGFGVVTNNEAHFARIPDLRVENWLA